MLLGLLIGNGLFSPNDWNDLMGSYSNGVSYSND